MSGGNFGPLTTPFTPPASCASLLASTWRLSATDGRFLHAGPTATSDCFPPRYDDARTNFFSPGLFCPAGYTTACQSLTSSNPSAALETVATCCPDLEGGTYLCNTASGFSWQSSAACRQAFFEGATGTQPTTITIFSVSASRSTTTSGTGTDDTEVATTSRTVSAVTTVTNDGYNNAAVNAYGVVLRWKEGDNGTASSGSSKGLSSGAAAGIGVGVAVGVLLLVGAALWAFCAAQRRRRRREGALPVDSVDEYGGGQHGYDMARYPGREREMDASKSPTSPRGLPQAELSPTTTTTPVEMGVPDIVEMPADGVGDRGMARREH